MSGLARIRALFDELGIVYQEDGEGTLFMTNESGSYFGYAAYVWEDSDGRVHVGVSES